MCTICHLWFKVEKKKEIQFQKTPGSKKTQLRVGDQNSNLQSSVLWNSQMKQIPRVYQLLPDFTLSTTVVFHLHTFWSKLHPATSWLGWLYTICKRWSEVPLICPRPSQVLTLRPRGPPSLWTGVLAWLRWMLAEGLFCRHLLFAMACCSQAVYCLGASCSTPASGSNRPLLTIVHKSPHSWPEATCLGKRL